MSLGHSTHSNNPIFPNFASLLSSCAVDVTLIVSKNIGTYFVNDVLYGCCPDRWTPPVGMLWSDLEVGILLQDLLTCGAVRVSLLVASLWRRAANRLAALRVAMRRVNLKLNILTMATLPCPSWQMHMTQHEKFHQIPCKNLCAKTTDLMLQWLYHGGLIDTSSKFEFFSWLCATSHKTIPLIWKNYSSVSARRWVESCKVPL